MQVRLQEFLGWFSKNCDENPRMCNIFNSKSPPKGRACADSRRNFWKTNLKTPVDLESRFCEIRACVNFSFKLPPQFLIESLENPHAQVVTQCPPFLKKIIFSKSLNFLRAGQHLAM